MNRVPKRVHRLAMRVRFPEGISPGERSESNSLAIAVDGEGRAILRGSSITGVLRRAYAAAIGERSAGSADEWFGRATGDRAGAASRVQVLDVRFPRGVAPTMRTHNGMDRHRGAPLDGALFSIAALPPGVGGTLVLIVEDEEHDGGCSKRFLETIVEALKRGPTFGGRGARGIGRAELDGAVRYRCFELAQLDEHAAWLDESVALAKADIDLAALSGEPLGGTTTQEASAATTVLRVQFALRTPRGQDVLFGGGEGCEFAVEPQRIRAADGADMLRFPGSALRGVMRSWVARLARRAGHPVVDSVERASLRRDNRTQLTGDDLGWGFAPPGAGQAAVAAADACPVLRLFGSLRGKGRVHIADALVRLEPKLLQTRKHVSVDRISGGASEGFLFDSQHTIRLDGPSALRFVLTVHRPSQEEASWLASTLRAIDLGVLRVGSSKSSGRLALAERPTASGPHADVFTRLEVERGN